MGKKGLAVHAHALCQVGLTLPGSASQLVWGAGAAYRGSGAAGAESDPKQATQLPALAAYAAAQAPTGSSPPARHLPRPRLRAAAPAARRRPRGSARVRAVSAPLRWQPSCTTAAGQGSGRRQLAGALAERSSLRGERTSLLGMKCRLTPALLITMVRMQPARPAQRGYDWPMSAPASSGSNRRAAGRAGGHAGIRQSYACAPHACHSSAYIIKRSSTMKAGSRDGCTADSAGLPATCACLPGAAP